MMKTQKMVIPELVYLKEDTHQYFDNDGVELLSMSRVLSSIKKKFDSHSISYGSARKQLRIEGIENPTEMQIEMRAAALRDQWKKKNNRANDIGTKIHKAFEEYIDTGIVNVGEDFDLMEVLMEVFHSHLSGYNQILTEQILYNFEYRMAGTADVICHVKDNIVDLKDFKTNISGLTYHNEYDQYYLSPFESVMESKYFTYCLQLSGYAWMLKNLGYRVRSAEIIYVPGEDPKNWKHIPVPLMYNEFSMLVESKRAELKLYYPGFEQESVTSEPDPDYDF